MSGVFEAGFAGQHQHFLGGVEAFERRSGCSSAFLARPEAGAIGRETQVATTNAEWHALWSSLRRDPAPAFDPSRQTGVAILLGQRPTPGYHIGILGTEQRGDRVIVVIEEARPQGRTVLPHRVTSPYAILLIDQSGAPVSVEQRVRD